MMFTQTKIPRENFKILLMIMILGMLFVSGCKENKDIAFFNGSNQFNELEDNSSKNETKMFKSIFDNDYPNTYCYQDNSKSVHCKCDVWVYPDGHNETKNCWCFDDLVMHYTCVNLTKENITVLRSVEI